MSYDGLKKHLFNKSENKSHCGKYGLFTEYAKTIDEVDCFYCKKLIKKTLDEINNKVFSDKLIEIREYLEKGNQWQKSQNQTQSQ